MIARTATRVSDNTAAEVNQRIREQTQNNVARIAIGGPAAIDRRLAQLDEEWDIERFLGTVAPTISLTGLLLAAGVNKKFLIVPAIIQTFLLQHALQGWCPPMPVLRRLGVRTIEEIDEERYALKTLRGDFRDMSDTSGGSATRVRDVMDAVRK